MMMLYASLILCKRALDGYTHELGSTLTEQQQRDVLDKSIKVATAFTGEKPKEWTAPAWSASKEIIRLLEEFSIVSKPLPSFHIMLPITRYL